MSKRKKSFTDGLGDMFTSALEDTHGDLFQESKPVDIKVKRKRSSGDSKKSFASDLNDFFQEAIKEGVREKSQSLKSGQKSKSRKRRTKPVFGIDNLIRQTLEDSEMKAEKKRISFTFETEKIEKLKEIASLEKARIRDIVDELITHYIREHKVKN